MPRSPGRTGHRWRQVSKIVIDMSEHCWLCGKPVDKTLSGRHPLGPSVDHVVPLFMGGDPLDISNLRLSHTRCNSARGNKMRAAAAPKKVQSRRSRVW